MVLSKERATCSCLSLCSSPPIQNHSTNMKEVLSILKSSRIYGNESLAVSLSKRI